MKVAVYAIAKNEAHNVAGWLEGVKSADGIFVLDTGSTDNTVELLEAAGVTVSRMSGTKAFRFDHARNEALAMVPDDFDVCMSMDFDERISSNWREVIETFETDVANYTLVFSMSENGTAEITYNRLAIHRKTAGLWKYAAHEIFVPHDGRVCSDLPIYVVHTGTAKPAGHYLKLLEISYKEDPKDCRTVSYLAREYMYIGNYAMAIPLYLHVVEYESSPPARMDASLQIAKMQQDQWVAEWYFRQAIQMCNDIREPYCEMAMFYFRNKKWEHAIAMIKSALDVPHDRRPYDIIYNNNFYSDVWIEHMLMACYQQDDNLRKALNHMDAALAACGDGPVPQTLLKDAQYLQRTVQDKFHAYSSCFGRSGSEPKEMGKEAVEGRVSETPLGGSEELPAKIPSV